MSIDEKTNIAKKYDVNIKTYKKWNFSESITWRYLLSAYHRLHLWYMSNKMVINEKEYFVLSISSWIYVKYWIEI